MAITPVSNIDLSSEISEWKNAIYGRDVRNANVKAFEKIQGTVNQTIQNVNSAASQIDDIKTAAIQSAQNAAASEQASKVSETNSKDSETNAKSSETNAASSEKNAKASATKASSSEVASAAYEMRAQEAAESAESSKTTAENAKKAAEEAASHADAMRMESEDFYNLELNVRDDIANMHKSVLASTDKVTELSASVEKNSKNTDRWSNDASTAANNATEAADRAARCAEGTQDAADATFTYANVAKTSSELCKTYSKSVSQKHDSVKDWYGELLSLIQEKCPNLYVDRGDYSPNAVYNKNDMVFYNGSSWAATTNGVSGIYPETGNVPLTDKSQELVLDSDQSVVYTVAPWKCIAKGTPTNIYDVFLTKDGWAYDVEGGYYTQESSNAEFRASKHYDILSGLGEYKNNATGELMRKYAKAFSIVNSGFGLVMDKIAVFYVYQVPDMDIHIHLREV